MRKNAIILTKSAKYNNYCVAGVDPENGEWIRFENKNLSGGAVSEDDMRLDDGTICDILDIVSVEVLDEDAALPYQPENVFINPEVRWTKTGHATWKQVLNVHPAEATWAVLGTKYASMKLDYVRNEMRRTNASLQLIEFHNLVIEASEKKETDEWKHPKGTFIYRSSNKGENIEYRLTITDEDYWPAMESRTIAHGYMIVSLGLPYTPDTERDPQHYLLIAKIMEDLQDPYLVTESRKTHKKYYHLFQNCPMASFAAEKPVSKGIIFRDQIMLCKECQKLKEEQDKKRQKLQEE